MALNKRNRTGNMGSQFRVLSLYHEHRSRNERKPTNQVDYWQICFIWPPLKVVHDWIRICKARCDSVFCFGCELQEITGVGVFWRCDLIQYSWIYSDISDFIFEKKWQNCTILERWIRQIKMPPFCPDDQIRQLNTSPSFAYLQYSKGRACLSTIIFTL